MRSNPWHYNIVSIFTQPIMIYIHIDAAFHRQGGKEEEKWLENMYL